MCNIKLNGLKLNTNKINSQPLADPKSLFPDSVSHPKTKLSTLQLPDIFNNNSNKSSNTNQKKTNLSFVETSDNEFKTNTNLQSFISEKMKEIGLKDAGVVVIDINSGEIASVNGNKPFYPASVIKLPVMVEAFHQAAGGKISLDQPVTVKSDNVAPTWLPDGDKRPLLNTGSKVTVKKLIELMITRSDNTATNVLIELLGRKNITDYMKNLGLNHIEVNRKLSVDVDRQATGRNTMTSDDTAKLLSMIAKGKLVNQQSSQDMLNILGGQMDNEKIPPGLPKGSKVYHKTGETSNTCHDASIIKYGDKTYIMTVFTNMSPGSATNKITNLSSKISHLPEFQNK